MTAPLFEIFSSVQGEGLLVGERQVFLRFCGCNLDCAYCDTLAARGEPSVCRVEPGPGGGGFGDRANPMAAREVADAVRRLERPQPGLHHSVALTGGEPLLQARFLLELLPMVGDLGLGVYLETNGTLAEELLSVLPHLDAVCADIKVPSSTRQAPIWGVHERFLLALAAHEDPGRLDFAKCVVTGDCLPDEIETAARIVAGVNADMALVLQPVTAMSAGIRAPSARQMLDLQGAAKRHLGRVRAIPQMHRIMGWR